MIGLIILAIGLVLMAMLAVWLNKRALLAERACRILNETIKRNEQQLLMGAYYRTKYYDEINKCAEARRDQTKAEYWAEIIEG